MIRITELQLPLDYTAETLRQAVLKHLAISASELPELTLLKRSHDARRSRR